MKPKALRRSIKLLISSQTDQKRRKKTQIANMRNDRGDITTDSTDIKRILREYYKQ